MLNVKKKISVEIFTTDNKPIKEGDTVLVKEKAGKTLVGKYNGFVKSGAINLKMNFLDIETDFNIMPKSIEKIYLVTISCSDNSLGKEEGHNTNSKEENISCNNSYSDNFFEKIEGAN